MDFFRVTNWDQYQHYKDRDPTWIKLYARLLDDYEFATLPDNSSDTACFRLFTEQGLSRYASSSHNITLSLNSRSL